MPAPLNIILIDDHPLLRLGVAGYINQEEGLRMTAQLAMRPNFAPGSPPATRPMSPCSTAPCPTPTDSISSPKCAMPASR
jgi:hypothetical protein